MKTPLREPNSFVCGPTLRALLPADATLKGLMFFSGQLEFPLISNGHAFTAYTNRPVIFEFWQSAVQDAHRLAAYAEGMHLPDIHPNEVSLFQTEWPTYRDPFMRSAVFFLLNRYSPTGTISHGQIKPDNLSPFAIETLKNFSSCAHRLNLKFYDAERMEAGIRTNDNNDILLIPVGRFSHNLLTLDILEGHETYNVNHRWLKEELMESGRPFVLCYKAHRGVLQLYGDQQIILVSKFGKPTSHFDLAEDIIVHNLDKHA